MGLELQKRYDNEMLELLSKMYDRKTIGEILDTLSLVVSQQDKKRIDEVKYKVENGENLMDALKEEKLITEQLYCYLYPASQIKTFKQFTQEYLMLRKEMRSITTKLIGQAISPIASMIISVFAMYVILYKTLPAFSDVLTPTGLSVAPFYFPFLVEISKHPVMYYMFVGVLITTLGTVITLRNKIFKNVYGLYERIKLYVHMYLSIISGIKIDEAILSYKGEIIKKDLFEQLLLQGESLEDTFLNSLTVKVIPIERI